MDILFRKVQKIRKKSFLGSFLSLSTEEKILKEEDKQMCQILKKCSYTMGKLLIKINIK